MLCKEDSLQSEAVKSEYKLLVYLLICKIKHSELFNNTCL